MAPGFINLQFEIINSKQDEKNHFSAVFTEKFSEFSTEITGDEIAQSSDGGNSGRVHAFVSTK